MMLKLKAEKREKKEKLVKIREAGLIPAVYYGPKQESTPIKISSSDFQKLYREAGESTLIDLMDGSENHDVLIKDVVIDPVKEHVLHVDFYAIERGKKLELDVELDFIGESPAEKKGDLLVKVAHTLEVESLPRNLPSDLKVDLTKLEKIGDQILAKDIELPEGVELIGDSEEVIALIKEAREEEAEEPVEAVDMDAIEVEEKGKKEEDSADSSDSDNDSKGEEK